MSDGLSKYHEKLEQERIDKLYAKVENTKAIKGLSTSEVISLRTTLLDIKALVDHVPLSTVHRNRFFHLLRDIDNVLFEKTPAEPGSPNEDTKS